MQRVSVSALVLSNSEHSSCGLGVFAEWPHDFLEVPVQSDYDLNSWYHDHGRFRKGYFNLNEGSTSCDACPAGRFKNNTGALDYITTDHVTCQQCFINHYQNATGQALCNLYV